MSHPAGDLRATGVAAVVTADRVGKGIRTAPRDAMISSATPTEHLGQAFGVHRMLDTFGAALGPLIAFGLLWAVPGGYSVVLVVSLAFAAVGVALLGLLAPDQRIRSDRTGPTPPPFRARDLADRRLSRRHSRHAGPARDVLRRHRRGDRCRVRSARPRAGPHEWDRRRPDGGGGDPDAGLRRLRRALARARPGARGIAAWAVPSWRTSTQVRRLDRSVEAA